MSLFDKFKKNQEDKKVPKPADSVVEKKEVPKPKTAKPAPVKKEKPVKKEITKKKEGKTVKKETAKKGPAESKYAHKALLKPIISEKSALLNSSQQYVFMVSKRTNKVEIKRAIKEVYNVEPVAVKIINVRGKKVRRGKISGTTKDYKKAIVQMPKGVELPIYEGV